MAGKVNKNTEEMQLEIIEMQYKGLSQIRDLYANDGDKSPYQDGALFGMRFVLLTLGYELDFKEWEENPTSISKKKGSG